MTISAVTKFVQLQCNWTRGISDDRSQLELEVPKMFILTLENIIKTWACENCSRKFTNFASSIFSLICSIGTILASSIFKFWHGYNFCNTAAGTSRVLVTSSLYCNVCFESYTPFCFKVSTVPTYNILWSVYYRMYTPMFTMLVSWTVDSEIAEPAVLAMKRSSTFPFIKGFCMLIPWYTKVVFNVLFKWFFPKPFSRNYPRLIVA